MANMTINKRRRGWYCLAAGVLLGLWLRSRCSDEPPALGPISLRLATFNIENYPKSERQEVGAFALLRDLRVDAVGVQEITDPAALERAAQRHLGPQWRFVYTRRIPKHRVGVLYDGGRFKLRLTRSYREPEIGGPGKAAFEARLEP